MHLPKISHSFLTPQDKLYVAHFHSHQSSIASNSRPHNSVNLDLRSRPLVNQMLNVVTRCLANEDQGGYLGSHGVLRYCQSAGAEMALKPHGKKLSGSGSSETDGEGNPFRIEGQESTKYWAIYQDLQSQEHKYQ